MPLSR
ncbi:hypothetical protein YPPY52_3740, partial [Yersinia pestis PY-52]